MVARTRGRPAHSAVSNDSLLETALQSSVENGYDGASVREIARRLANSHNQVAQRFGSKETLWYAAVDHGFGRLEKDLLRRAEAILAQKL